MLTAFATVEQYEARFGAVEDQALLAECLEDASAAIRSAASRARLDVSEPDEDLADRLMRVCRSVANRLMPTGDSQVMQGVTQMGVTAGSYTEQYTFQSSYGTPKLLPSELDMLGLGGSSGRVLLPSYGGDAE